MFDMVVQEKFKFRTRLSRAWELS